MTELERYNAFCEIAMLNKEHDPWVKRRPYRNQYGVVLIAKARDPELGKWSAWWDAFVGLEVFCELQFQKNPYTDNPELVKAYAVRLTGTKMHHGRSIPAEYFILV